MVDLDVRPIPGRTSEAGPTFKSVAVVGAAGQVGELFARTLAPHAHIEAAVREYRWRDEIDHPDVRFHANIGAMLATEPEAVILATPNPTDEVLAEIALHAQKPLTLILPQNGVDVVDKAEKVLRGSKNLFTIVRASLFTNVRRDAEGNIAYNPKKKRIALSPVGEDPNDSLGKAENMFKQAGFDVKVVQDYQSMERSKLLANLFGSTSTVTGLSPREALSDPEIFSLEHRALKDRLRILKAAGIKVADLWGIGRLRWLSRVPGPIASMFRVPIANMFAAERNNQPPAAARQINEGARTVEPTVFYHRPISQSGRAHGLESPVDEAIMDILKRHGHTNNNFSLASLEAEKRRKFLLEIFGYETKQVFIRGFFPLELAVNGFFEYFVDRFDVLGRENLQAVAESLSQEKNVLMAPNHRSHADHLAVIKALRKSLPKEARKYPVYVVAGMKFDQEPLTGFFNHAYSHPAVVTITEGDSEEERWKAQIINRRASKEIERLLKEPCVFVVYLEGGRSKIVWDGKVQLQNPALGSSSWLLNPKFDLVVPTVITGTERMLPPGNKWPRHADIAVEFCDAIETDKLREKVRVPRKERDNHFSDIVLRIISAKLPKDERGSY